MTKYYGVGTWWKKDDHQYYHEFIKDKTACISTSLDKPTQREINNRKRFREVFLSIEIGDVIYLKANITQYQKILMRAIGIVVSMPKNSWGKEYIHCC